MIHGPQEECVQALRNGHLLGISPGGVREALFSDETYPLLWGKRKGFAQVALDSQVVGWLSSVEAGPPPNTWMLTFSLSLSLWCTLSSSQSFQCSLRMCEKASGLWEL